MDVCVRLCVSGLELLLPSGTDTTDTACTAKKHLYRILHCTFSLRVSHRNRFPKLQHTPHSFTESRYNRFLEESKPSPPSPTMPTLYQPLAGQQAPSGTLDYAPLDSTVKHPSLTRSVIRSLVRRASRIDPTSDQIRVGMQRKDVSALRTGGRGDGLRRIQHTLSRGAEHTPPGQYYWSQPASEYSHRTYPPSALHRSSL